MRCVLGSVFVLLACSSSGPTENGLGGIGGLPGTGTGGNHGAGDEGNPAENPPGDPGHPPPGAKRAFVTSSRYAGDLKTVSGATDGLAGGDRLCQTAADAATLGGTWKAWLSAGASGPGGATTHAVDRVADVGPWFRLDGETAFNNKANLMTSPLVPLIDENRRLVLENREVWTGTALGGRSTGQDCTQWTSGNGVPTGTIGNAGKTDGSWTAAGPDSCSFGRRLYCLEQ